MALTIKHINDDASFLLTLEPLASSHSNIPPPRPFYILLDPWIVGPSKVFHSKLSMTTQRERACISSLLELPEPDLVIVSQDKTDHLNKATLKQLPHTGAKTLILAEPTSARIIKSWNYFDKDKVRTIPKWEDSQPAGNLRIPVPPVGSGLPGEVTVAFIPQRRDITGLHSAIGITYRPPATPPPPPPPSQVPRNHQLPATITPPSTPTHGREFHLRFQPTSPRQQGSTPTCPAPLRPARSVASLPANTHQATTRRPTSQPSPDRPLSIIFSPHGITYDSLHSYITSHLISEAALPLTALLHCFDTVTSPWWLGGSLLHGAPAGAEIANKLEARAWISAHDGDKDIKGFLTNFLSIKRFRPDDVLDQLRSSSCESGSGTPESPASRLSGKARSRQQGTEVIRLGIGEEARMTGDSVLGLEGGCGLVTVPYVSTVSGPRPWKRNGAGHASDESWLDLGDEGVGGRMKRR